MSSETNAQNSKDNDFLVQQDDIQENRIDMNMNKNMDIETTTNEDVKTIPLDDGILSSSTKATKSKLFYGTLLELCLQRGMKCHVANNYLYSFVKDKSLDNDAGLVLMTKQSAHNSLKQPELKDFHPVINDEELLMVLSYITNKTDYKHRVMYVDCSKHVDFFQYVELGSTGKTLGHLYKFSPIGKRLSEIEVPSVHELTVCRIYYGENYCDYTVDATEKDFRRDIIKLLDHKIEHCPKCYLCSKMTFRFKCCPMCNTYTCENCFLANAVSQKNKSEMKCINPCCNFIFHFHESSIVSDETCSSSHSVTTPGFDK